MRAADPTLEVRKLSATPLRPVAIVGRALASYLVLGGRWRQVATPKFAELTRAFFSRFKPVAQA